MSEESGGSLLDIIVGIVLAGMILIGIVYIFVSFTGHNADDNRIYFAPTCNSEAQPNIIVDAYHYDNNVQIALANAHWVNLKEHFELVSADCKLSKDWRN